MQMQIRKQTEGDVTGSITETGEGQYPIASVPLNFSGEVLYVDMLSADVSVDVSSTDSGDTTFDVQFGYEVDYGVGEVEQSLLSTPSNTGTDNDTVTDQGRFEYGFYLYPVEASSQTIQIYINVTNQSNDTHSFTYDLSTDLAFLARQVL